MINNYITLQISQKFPHHPTEEQLSAIQELADFVLSERPNELLLLTGYAGTGKTSLVGAFVKALTELKLKTILLAPTGRAAKVFAGYAEERALTIHKKIYRQKVFSNDTGNFVAANNPHKDTIFIVDEASMIANDGFGGFGSGRLLDDLIHFVYSGERCRLLLIGDVAQLPPVTQEESPALDPVFLEGYGLIVRQVRLKRVVRQASDSGILFNATRLREALRSGEVFSYPKLRVEGFPDLYQVSGSDLIETLSSSYARDGLDETIVITRSNKRANIYNQGIRNRVLFLEEELTAGDRLMVVRNNYHWCNPKENLDFIANGEILRVRRVRREQELYGFRFADILADLPDHDLELEMKVLLDTLQSESPALPKEQNDQLFEAVLADYADEPAKVERIRKLKEDPFYNAAQIKYAYAITCHKAQGGQWMNVFLDLGYITEEMMGEAFYRWLYTAFTRATHRIYLVNFPEMFVESRIG